MVRKLPCSKARSLTLKLMRAINVISHDLLNAPSDPNSLHSHRLQAGFFCKASCNYYVRHLQKALNNPLSQSKTDCFLRRTQLGFG